MATIIFLALIIGYTVFMIMVMSDPKDATDSAVAGGARPERADLTAPVGLNLPDTRPLSATEILAATGETREIKPAPVRHRQQMAFFEMVGPEALDLRSLEHDLDAASQPDSTPPRQSRHVLDLRTKD